MATERHISAEELFRQHAPFVARFLFRLGVRPDGIEDAVQEVFLVVHRQGGYRPGAAKPTSYLANLAVHAAAASRRRERARRGRETGAVEEVASAVSDPVEVLETNESLRRVQDALDRLEPDLRTTLVLVEIEGEACASIAATMGIPVGTVYWRLHQARKKFQRILSTIEATVPHRELAAQVAGLLGTLRPERKERTRTMVFLMTSPSWRDSAAHDLLRLAAARPPVNYAVGAGLERHRHLVGSGAPSPSWARGLGAGGHAAPWTTAALAVATIAAAVVLVTRAGIRAPSSQSSPITIVAPVRTPSARAPSASGWAAPATSEPMPAGSSIPVELLPLVAPSSAPPPHAAGSGDPSRPEAPADSPHASSPSPSDDGLLELRQVAKAERLLSQDPARALALARDVEARFPHGYVREERDYVEVMALIAMGRLDEARPKVTDFLRAYPVSTFSRRVREASQRALQEP